TGKFLGQVTDSSGKVLANGGLWDLVFGGGGSSGDPSTLYLTAGGSNQPNFPAGGSTTSVFASLVPAAAVTGADFTLNLSAQSANISPGGSANITVSASGVGGFNNQISLSCSSSAGLTCAFNPSTISPGSSAASSTLTISAASVAPPGGYGPIAMALLPGLGLFGTFLTSDRKLFRGKRLVAISLLGFLLFVSLLAVGCGSSNSKAAAPGSQVNVMVTGTSGSIKHSSTLSINIR
ncbi:MAG: hypothetical protein JOZ36_04980, partial [Acidobacteria bacterium]|nr:hypothetical protein [Acidobacteriota bacterium]